MAEEAADQLVSGALSKQQAHKERVNDLVGRWFNASPAERAKVPVTYKGMGQSITEPGSLDIVRLSGDLPQFAAHFSNLSGSEQFDKWLYYFGDYGDSFAGVASTDYLYRKDYLINSFTGDGTVGYGSMDERAQWMYWYDYFEGTTPSGGTGGGGTTAIQNPLVMTGVYGSRGNSVIGHTVTINFSSNFYNSGGYADFQQNYSYYVAACYNYTGDMSTLINTNIIACEVPISIVQDGSYIKLSWQAGKAVQMYSLTMENAGSGWNVDDVVKTCTAMGRLHGTNTTGSWNIPTRWAYIWPASGSGGGGGGGSDTPIWPVYPEPDTPSPPATPDNVTYVVNEGDTVTHVTNNTTTTTVDLTPILEAIRAVNSNIISYGDAINADFDTLSSNIAGCFETFTDYFGDWMETISGQLQTWNEQFLTEIRRVEVWLESIFYKIPGGGSSVPDPTTDDGEYFDWLNYLINLILAKLGLLDSLTDFSDLLEQLRTVFPFSVPWDVAAILGLFAHDPVTPVFDVPYPTYVNGHWTTRGVSCDLTPWNGVAQVCRTFIKILFAYYLALWTREGLKNFEVSSDD